MTAKEMFEDLGYWENSNECLSYETEYKWDMNTLAVIEWVGIYFENESYYKQTLNGEIVPITTEENKAIQKQIEELKW